MIRTVKKPKWTREEVTQKYRYIMRLWQDGVPVREIARRLGQSKESVGNYIYGVGAFRHEPVIRNRANVLAFIVRHAFGNDPTIEQIRFANEVLDVIQEGLKEG